MKSNWYTTIILMTGLSVWLSSFQYVAHSYDYDQAWKEVKDYQSNGLPKSALKKVIEIYNVARSEGNSGEQIKSTIFEASIRLNTEEIGLENVIKLLDDRTQDMIVPAKQILYSLSAELMQRYFRNNYYSISKRTDLDQYDTGDIRTWTPNNYRIYITDKYLKSLKGDEIKTSPISDYKVVIHNLKEDNRSLRPYLYDLLLDRAIQYFSDTRMLGIQPSFTFKIDNPKFFAQADTFCSQTFVAKDTSSQWLKVVQLYQDALCYHIENNNDEALASYDERRLSFVYNNAEIANKKKIYSHSLIQAAAYHNGSSSYRFMYLRGQLLRAHDQLEEAIEIFEKIKNTCNNRSIKSAAQSELDLIYLPNRQIQVEDTYTTSESIRFLLSSKNTTSVQLSLVKVKDLKSLENIRYQNKISKVLKHANIIKSWTVDSMHGGLRMKSQEVQLDDTLSYGLYALLLLDKSIHDINNNILSVGLFSVSDLALSQYRGTNKTILLVRNRNTGIPVENAEIQFFKPEYDPNTRKNKNTWIKSKSTNQDGEISLNNDDHQHYLIKVNHNRDTIDRNNHLYINRSYSESQKQGVVELFLDRAIYRPGQSLFFKGMAMQFDQKQIPQLIDSGKAKVTLKDANNQTVQETEISINDYGSFSGSFILPTGRLTGQYALHVQTDQLRAIGNTYFQIEEYKRPKYIVEIADNKEKIKLGDTVKIKGQAIAYSGANITNASYTYSVKRSIRYNYWSRRYGSHSKQIIVKQGSAKTTSDGKFAFEFVASTDKDLRIEDHPKYHYTIEVQVKDITGETQNASTYLQIAPLPYEYKITLPTISDLSDLDHILLTAVNAQNQNTSSRLQLTITQLIEPSKWQKPKYWLPASTQVNDSQINLNSEEKILSSYPEGDVALTEKINVNPQGTILDWSTILKAGSYKITLQSDETVHGTPIKKTIYIAINDKRKDNYRPLQLLYTSAPKKKYRVGDKIILHLATPLEAVKLRYSITKNGSMLKSEWVDVRKSASISYTVKKADLGGLSIKIDAIKSNRYIQKIYPINIPWDDKKLDITLKTYRDKIEPGHQEEWTLQILDKHKKGLDAELLASMYDASLDQFVMHQYRFQPYPSEQDRSHAYTLHFGMGRQIPTSNQRLKNYINFPHKIIPKLMGISDYHRGLFIDKRQRMKSRQIEHMEMPSSSPDEMSSNVMLRGNPTMEDESISDTNSEASITNSESSISSIIQQENATNEIALKTRNNLNETVFFYPHLKTDKEGIIQLSFKMNEALTSWKFLGMAHDQSLKYGIIEQKVKTQKDLMIIANAPRFLRAGDQVFFPAKISNLTDSIQQTSARLQLTNPIDGTDLNLRFGLSQNTIEQDLNPKESKLVTWHIQVPHDYNGLIKYQVSIQGDSHTDGEENILAVLTDRKLVTESKTMHVRANETKTFTFDKISGSSATTASPHSLTLEYTSNPIWYAVQALPYILESSHQYTERVANRLYANMVAAHIAQSHPKIKAVFDAWTSTDTDALESNLNKNEELKSALLEETPWVRNALSETEQKKMIAVLFDLNRLGQETIQTLDELSDRQRADGSFSWFAEGPSSVYTTHNVVENLLHLRHLDILSKESPDTQVIIEKAMAYLDRQSTKRYNQLITSGANLADNHLDYLSIHYMYLRSMDTGHSIAPDAITAYEYYQSQAAQYWNSKNLYAQAMIGLSQIRTGNKNYDNIAKSLKEKSFYSEELGRYWNLANGYNWHELPIESHAMLIAFFSAYEGQSSFLEDMKIWLLKNKQTNHWATSKATAAAIYALMIPDDKKVNNWILETARPEIQIGATAIAYDNDNAEVGSGYIKKTYTADEIDPTMQSITVKNNNGTIGWGAAYYQYFEDLDKIESFVDTPLNVSKKLFLQKNTDYGPKLIEIDPNTIVSRGDRIISRIEIKVNRSMSYVHLQDMRPSGLEPEHTLSGYKRQGLLSYYESTRDMASHFFIPNLSKGTYVFEYPLRAVHKGNFSTGIATLQCLYAPAYNSHSEGSRIDIK